MDFEPGFEQKVLAKSARDFFTENWDKSLLRRMAEDEKGYLPELWRKMADMGWLGIIFPDKYGGSGGRFLDLTTVLEEMGRSSFTSPFFCAVALSGMAILDLGNEAQKEEILPAISRGNLIVTLALTEASAKYSADGVSVKAVAGKSGYTIKGIKLFVPYAHVAERIICVARTGGRGQDGITLLLVDARSQGLQCSPLKAMTGSKQSEVSLASVKVPAQSVVGKVGDAWPGLHQVLQKAAVAKCAEMVGGMQRVLEMTVSWAKERTQFGRPIGSFQAVQHHCANMAIDVDVSRLLTYEAAWRVSEALPYATEAAMAKAWVSDAYRRTAALGHQVMAGVAFIEDHDMPWFFRSAKEAEVTFGDSEFQREIVASRIGL